MLIRTKLLYSMIMILSRGILTKQKNVKSDDMNYILLWSKELTPPFGKMNQGQNIFIERNCKYRNCFVTNEENYFNDILHFDALVFMGPKIMKTTKVPSKRTDDQLYIFASTDSAKDYPIDSDFDWFFNLTWTYKLDSDIPFWPIVVRNASGTVVGPKNDMHWLNLRPMASDSDNLLSEKLQSKKSAVMWISDNFNLGNAIPESNQEYAYNLQSQMAKHGLRFDIYGKCGNFMCSSMKECLTKLETDYYFYFAAEDSICEDYVTDRLLYPLQHFAVPIVFGGANYSRFLPEGTYLDAKALPVEDLTIKLRNIINDKDRYREFFKWQKYYTFERSQDSPDTDGYCALCAVMNNRRRRQERKVYAHFSRWWNVQPYETDELSLLKPASVVSYERDSNKTIILDNPYVLTSRSIEKKEKAESGFFKFIADVINYYFDTDL